MTYEESASARLLAHLEPHRSARWDDAVLARTKLCLLDSLACAAAGLALPHFRQSAAAAGALFAWPAGPESPASPFATAYLYGQAANALDFDDTLFGHPGSPIVGTLLALGSAKRLSVDQLLRGIAAGYDAHAVLCDASTPSPERALQVRSVGIWDTVAASIGAAVALGFDDARIGQVIGVAAAHSILPYTGRWYERPVPAMKNNMGWIAAGAVMAVHLALEGQTGVTRVLDGDTGMWRMVGSDRWAMDDALAQRPAVLRTGFKAYPSCWHTQAYLKAFAAQLDALGPGEEITETVVAGPADIEKFCDPKVSASADIAFSLPALFELLIARIEPGPQWESVAHAQVRRGFHHERTAGRYVEVRTSLGRVLTGAVEVGRASDLARHGVDDAGVVAKFERLAPADVRAAVQPLLAPGVASPDDVPDALYRSVHRSLTAS